MTLMSHNNIQTSQITTLQTEISTMIDKLEDIKDTYETELDQREAQLQNNRNMAIKQLKNMQQAMRQDTVNNQKEVLKLRSELKIKMEKKEKELALTLDSKAMEKRLGRSPGVKKGKMSAQKKGRRSNS